MNRQFEGIPDDLLEKLVYGRINEFDMADILAALKGSENETDSTIRN